MQTLPKITHESSIDFLGFPPKEIYVKVPEQKIVNINHESSIDQQYLQPQIETQQSETILQKLKRFKEDYFGKPYNSKKK